MTRREKERVCLCTRIRVYLCLCVFMCTHLSAGALVGDKKARGCVYANMYTHVCALACTYARLRAYVSSFVETIIFKSNKFVAKKYVPSFQ